MTSLFKVSAATHTITPWRDWDEWTQCKDAFFAEPQESADVVDDADDDAAAPQHPAAARADRRRQAIQKVNAWRARGRVPLAVDSTAQIVELNLQHRYPPSAYAPVATSSSSSSSHVPSSSLQSRLEYSMALLRLVNGVLDPMQARQHAQSVNNLAKQMQMPRVLVDLRHESTHQGLPSLPLLQLASLSALEWLEKHYWSAQSHAVSKIADGVRHHLKEYKKRLDRAKENKKRAADANKEAAAENEPTVTLHSADGENVMLLDPTQSSVSSIVPEKAQDSLRVVYSTITSGHNVAHSQAFIETTLLPMLLSDVFLLKPPKQSRVSLSPVFRRLLETWDPALSFLAAKWRSQSLSLYRLLFASLVRRLAAATPVDEDRYNRRAATWSLDLMREWTLHLLRTQANVIFHEEHQAAAQSQHDNDASKKRSHTAMEAAAHGSVLDEAMHRCLKSLNPWLASLVPLLLPIFKRHHASRPESVSQLELLLHLATSRRFPQYRVAPPATITLNKPQPYADVQASIQQVIDERRALEPTVGPKAARLPHDGIELVRDFPFVPIGLVPDQDDATLWIEDEWVSSADLAAAAAAVAVAAVPASVSAPAAVAPPSADTDAMQVDSQESTDATPVQPSKRARVVVAPSPPVDEETAAASAQLKQAHDAAVQRFQQALVWV